MRSSVYREIPDDSIAGTKILDGTDVDYFGEIITGKVDVNSSGSSKVTLRTSSNFGRVMIRDGSAVTKFRLDANPGNDSYINQAIVFGAISFFTSKTTYPTQIVGNMAVNGAAYIAGNILTDGNILAASGSLSISSVIIGTTLGVTGLASFGEGLLKVGIYQPTNAQWGNLTNQDVTLQYLTSSEIFQLRNINSSTIGPTAWSHLNSLNQDISTGNNVLFNSVKITKSFKSSSGNFGSLTSYNIKDFDYRWWSFASGSLLSTLILDGTTSPSITDENEYIIHNTRVSGDVRLSAVGTDYLNGVLGGTLDIQNGNACILKCRSNYWYAVVIAHSPI